MEFAKHIHVLNLLRTIPALDARPVYDDSFRQQCADAFDHLFSYIHENWVEPDSAMGKKLCMDDYQWSNEDQKHIDDCNTMLRMPKSEFVIKLQSLPPYFSEILFPIAVARYLLRECELPINRRQTQQFGEFYRRYSRIVLADY